jgi:purine-binding chemotaxis protein CheW
MHEEYGILWSETDTFSALTFDILDQSFAIEAGLVQEIVDKLHETAVPGSVPPVGSIANYRGRVIPLADMHLAFGFVPTDFGPDTRIVVIEHDVQNERCLIGLKVDRVHEVAALKRSDAEAPPKLGLRLDRSMIRCLIKRRNAVIAVPDLSRLLTLPPSGPVPISTH